MPAPTRPLTLQQAFARTAADIRRAARSSSLGVQRAAAAGPGGSGGSDGTAGTAGSFEVPASIPADGATDATDALQAWLSGLPVGAKVLLRTDGAYLISGTGLLLDRPVWIDGQRCRLIRTPGIETDAGPIFRVRSSEVRISACELIGPGSDPYANSELGSAIYARADSYAGRFAQLTFEDLDVHGWGYAGIYVFYGEDVHTRRCRFTDNAYLHCGYLSVLRGSYTWCAGDNPTNPGGLPNTYGFQASRWGLSSLADAPRCEDIEVAHNYQRNTFWECLDTHGGRNIAFHHNRTAGRTGIAVVPSADPAGVDTYAPLDCRVEHNHHDGEVDDGSMSYGITFTGAEGSPLSVGSYAELGTGHVIGNTVLRAGNSAAKTEAMYLHTTRGVLVQGNRFVECATGGIQAYHDNYGAALVDNYAEECWTNAATPFTAAIRVRDQYNQLVVERNRYRATGTRAGAALRNDRGLYLATATNNQIVKGWNDWAGLATPYSPASSAGYVAMYA